MLLHVAQLVQLVVLQVQIHLRHLLVLHLAQNPVQLAAALFAGGGGTGTSIRHGATGGCSCCCCCSSCCCICKACHCCISIYCHCCCICKPWSFDCCWNRKLMTILQRAYKKKQNIGHLKQGIQTSLFYMSQTETPIGDSRELLAVESKFAMLFYNSLEISHLVRI